MSDLFPNHSSVFISYRLFNGLLLSCPSRHCILASATQDTLLQFKTEILGCSPRKESPCFSQMLQLSDEAFQSHAGEALQKLLAHDGRSYVFSFGVIVERCCLVMGPVPCACLKHCI